MASTSASRPSDDELQCPTAPEASLRPRGPGSTTPTKASAAGALQGMAAEAHRRAANQGDVCAQFNLGMCYELGKGVPADAVSAAEWYTRAANNAQERDNCRAAAQCSLGWCYLHGRGVEQSHEEAVEWWLRAAENGSSAACFALGWHFDPANPDGAAAAAAAAKPAPGAEAGDTAAKAGASLGSGAAAKAVGWYQRAADLGNADAMRNLGLCYEHGRGVPADAKKAVRHYYQAARQAAALAPFNLGRCYELGIGVAVDAVQAAAWYAHAAKVSGTAVQRARGSRSYDYGGGAVTGAAPAAGAMPEPFSSTPPHLGRRPAAAAAEPDAHPTLRTAAAAAHTAADAPDPAEAAPRGAAHLLHPSAASGATGGLSPAATHTTSDAIPTSHSRAVAAARHDPAQFYQPVDPDEQYTMGSTYEKGNDLVRAAEWYRRAADQGHARAQHRIGRCYARGEGVAVDLDEAVAWYARAAAQHYPTAQSDLGACYYHGTGVVADGERAAHWFGRAARQGDALARYHLGMCYEAGNGVPIDEEQAAVWYLRAAEQGHVMAQYRLGTCYYYGKGVPVNAAQAVEWFHRAADYDVADACYYLGLCYERGTGVGADTVQALHWYKLAADRGSSDALAQLARLAQ